MSKADAALLTVQKCCKAGHRVEEFKLDAAVPKESFSLVAQAFFIGNSDVVEYFRLALSGVWMTTSTPVPPPAHFRAQLDACIAPATGSDTSR